MNINDFGEAHFPIGKNGCLRYVTCFGHITDIKDKIHFTDNDGIKYQVEPEKFEFKKCEFKNKFVSH